MKTNTLMVCVGVAAVLAMAGVAGASPHEFGVGVRYHRDHSFFTARPFSEGDYSISLAYEYHEKDVFWQLGCDITPDFRKSKDLHYGFTPLLNLILRDGMIQGGVGALTTYTNNDGGENWTDLYWQFLLGINLPIGPFTAQVNVFYVFDKWDHLSEADFADIEYGASLSYRF